MERPKSGRSERSGVAGEIDGKRKQERARKQRDSDRHRADKSLEEGLEESLPGVRPGQRHPAAAKSPAGQEAGSLSVCRSRSDALPAAPAVRFVMCAKALTTEA